MLNFLGKPKFEKIGTKIDQHALCRVEMVPLSIHLSVPSQNNYFFMFVLLSFCMGKLLMKVGGKVVENYSQVWKENWNENFDLHEKWNEN